jgi:hypothetical protein
LVAVMVAQELVVRAVVVDMVVEQVALEQLIKVIMVVLVFIAVPVIHQVAAEGQAVLVRTQVVALDPALVVQD